MTVQCAYLICKSLDFASCRRSCGKLSLSLSLCVCVCVCVREAGVSALIAHAASRTCLTCGAASRALLHARHWSCRRFAMLQHVTRGLLIARSECFFIVVICVTFVKLLIFWGFVCCSPTQSMALQPQWRQFMALVHELRRTDMAALMGDEGERRAQSVAFWVNVYNSLFLLAWVMRGAFSSKIRLALWVFL